MIDFDTAMLLITLLGYVLAQVIPFLPVSVSAKIPDQLMRVINLLAAKHNVSRVARTDIKGNPVTEEKKSK